jgi:hypothetical protein
MKIARPLVALVLALAPGSAGAECAWVLWTRDRQGWEYRAAFVTYDKCKDDIKRHLEYWGAGAKPERLFWNLEAWRVQGIDYECIPATIDPRADKR